MSSGRFGRHATTAGSILEFLNLERESRRAEQFAALDRLTGEILVGALQGKRLLLVKGGESQARGRPGILGLKDSSSEQSALLEELFAVEKQQSKGTWSLPETISAKVGIVHFAANLKEYGRFAHTATAEDRHKITLASSPTVLYYYAVLEPLFTAIYEPFALRGEQTAKKGKDEQVKRWRDIEAFFSSLGFRIEREVSVMRYGGGWSKLSATEQLETKRSLLVVLANQAKVSMASRYRVHRLLPLVRRYYKRASHDGRALRKRVLTRELERTISAYFGGGWLDFLDYLGEAPHPDEHVATALPQTKLYLGATRKAASDLGVEGLDEEHLRLITASLYGGQSSPVERRLEVMRRYWEAFDAIHAHQRSGMEPLWGLVADGRRVQLASMDDTPNREYLYERLLPRELLSDIEELWGSKMTTRNPGRIVTEPFPHVGMAEAFGPAFRFWHGCALTAWFLCEGPYSRTDMTGLENYHRRELEELEELGAPVDRSLFAELISAEGRLGPEQPAREEVIEIEIEPGVTAQSRFATGTRRDGFELLRDLVTKHRRSWAEMHLRDYLSKRAEGEIREAAKAFHRMSHDRSGKPPTIKQFAKLAQKPANHWFGGDVSAIYRAFGERSPVSPERVREIPEDVYSFAEGIYSTLGGTEERFERFHSNREEAAANLERVQRNLKASRLANLALEYLQLEEALGRAPSLKELGKSKFERQASDLLGDNIDAAYDSFVALVTEAKRLPGEHPKASFSSETFLPKYRVPRETETHWGSEASGEGLRPSDASVPRPESQPRTLPEENRKRSWWRRLLGR